MLSIQERDLARRLQELAVSIAVPAAPPLRRASSRNAVAIGRAMAAAIIVALVATVVFVGLRGARVTPASTPAVTPTLPSLASPPGPACPACSYNDGSGSFRIEGVVRDASGAPVGGARVAIHSGFSGSGEVVTSATTDASGAYTLTYQLPRLPAGQFWQSRIVAEKSAYETYMLQPYFSPLPDTGSADRTPRRVDLRLHQTVAIAAGGSARLVISPDDPICGQWPTDKDEWPCRIVRVTAPAAGRITVDVTWADPPSAILPSAHELGLQLLPQSVIGLRQDPPCCGRHESIDVREGEVIEVQVLFLNEGFFVRRDRSALQAARGPQPFDVSTSFTPK